MVQYNKEPDCTVNLAVISQLIMDAAVPAGGDAIARAGDPG